MDDDKLKERMEDMKTKAKSVMKIFSSPFALGSSSRSSIGNPQTFRGQGHRLGGSSADAPWGSGPPLAESQGRGCHAARKLGPGFGKQQQQQQCELRRLQQERWERERGVVHPSQPSPVLPSSAHRSSSSSSASRGRRSEGETNVIQSGDTLASAAASVNSPTPDRSLVERESRETVQVGNLAPAYSTASPAHFDPYSSIIASGTSHRPAAGGAVSRAPPPTEERQGGRVQCPMCQQWWQSESQVSAHIDDCTGGAQAELGRLSIGQGRETGSDEQREQGGSIAEDLDEAVNIFLSGGPSIETIDVIMKVFNNILKAPGDEKYRKLKLENPKIKETIGNATGGLRFLESFGFRSVLHGNDKCSLMDKPSREQQERMGAAIAYLDSYKSAHTAPAPSTAQTHPATDAVGNVNRQMRIFYASKDRLAERFQLPESFYNLTATEVKSEAAARKKKLEDSQLLIPKSSKDKQAANARKRYRAAVVRVQLPDGLVVQGFFKPREPTSSLYEFVASTLKDSAETFDLVLPAATKHRVIPIFSEVTGQPLTLEDVDLVPSALLKFNATGPQGYTCLKNECYDLCEPLTLTTLLEPGDFPKN